MQAKSKPIAPLDPAKARSFAQSVLNWYDAHARALPWRLAPQQAFGKNKKRPDPYRVWLSEIMLQQTTVATVGPYFAKFLERWPHVSMLAAAPTEHVLAEWAGLGYYARARNLHKCAQHVAARNNAFPTTSQELQKLPGIGPYTSAAIAAICFDEKIAVLDGNVERVLARFLALNEPVNLAKPRLREYLQNLVPDRAGDFAQAMMDLGATICAPKATQCNLCPLAQDCRGKALGNPTDWPIPAPKAKQKKQFAHAFVLFNSVGEILLQQRAETGLLASMMEVPNSTWGSEKSSPQYPVEGHWKSAGQVRHLFTHIDLTMNVWALHQLQKFQAEAWPETSALEAQSMPRWVPLDRLDQEAVPTLFRKVIAKAQPDS